jgi:TRAP-type C4-dicarboxylate transport system permease small subunit
MISAIEKFADYLLNIYKYALLFLIIVITIIATANVFLRYLINHPIYWSEEVCRYLHIWAVLLAASYGYKLRVHVSMSILVKYIPSGIRWLIELIMEIAIAIFLLTAGIYGVIMTINAIPQKMASTQLTMSAVYIALPLSCFTMLLLSAINILNYLSKRETLPTWGMPE